MSNHLTPEPHGLIYVVTTLHAGRVVAQELLAEAPALEGWEAPAGHELVVRAGYVNGGDTSEEPPAIHLGEEAAARLAEEEAHAGGPSWDSREEEGREPYEEATSPAGWRAPEPPTPMRQEPAEARQLGHTVPPLVEGGLPEVYAPGEWLIHSDAMSGDELVAVVAGPLQEAQGEGRHYLVAFQAAHSVGGQRAAGGELWLVIPEALRRPPAKPAA